MRIIDANANRLKEGLRVCEEVMRFFLGNQKLTGQLKRMRHEVDSTVILLANENLRLKARDSVKDLGRSQAETEFLRKDINDIFFANLSRAKESLRVLEEFSKLDKSSASIKFKQLRYTAYEIEKQATILLRPLRHSR